MTSRTALHVQGEQEYPVPALELPDLQYLPDIPALAQYEAVALFIQRTQAIQPDFALTNATAPAVAAVCVRLDGIPLAIELAAARVRVLSVQQIAARLHDCLPLLTVGSRTAPPRHRTLAATLDWSYELLSEHERTVFRRLAVFAGGWSLEAAEVVCSDDAVAPHEVLDLLAGLVHQSLVAVGQFGGEVRYRMLEPVRQYAQRLLQGDELASVQDRHLQYFTQLISDAPQYLIGADQVAWLERLERDLDNLRAALDRAIDMAAATSQPDLVTKALCLPADLERFWSPRGYSSEGIVRLHAGHKTPELVVWLFCHGIMPLYTPLGGSWLNMAESIQRIIVRRALAGQHRNHRPRSSPGWRRRCGGGTGSQRRLCGVENRRHARTPASTGRFRSLHVSPTPT